MRAVGTAKVRWVLSLVALAVDLGRVC